MTVRFKKIQCVLIVIMVANIAVALIKLVMGLMCGSNSLVADGIHSFSDCGGNIAGLIGIWLSSKPIDEKHPYGYEKFEILTSLFIGVMLVVMSVEIFLSAVASLKQGEGLYFGLIEFVLMTATVFVNIIVSALEIRFGEKLKSPVLIADSIHTKSDVFVSVAVIAGLLGIKLGLPEWFDGVISMGVAIVIFISAWEIIRDNVDVLADCAMVDCDDVRKALSDVPGIYNIHKIRSHGGETRMFIDLHIIANPDENVSYGHKLSHDIEKILKERYGEGTLVFVHIEPDDGKH